MSVISQWLVGTLLETRPASDCDFHSFLIKVVNTGVIYLVCWSYIIFNAVQLLLRSVHLTTLPGHNHTTSPHYEKKSSKGVSIIWTLRLAPMTIKSGFDGKITVNLLLLERENWEVIGCSYKSIFLSFLKNWQAVVLFTADHDSKGQSMFTSWSGILHYSWLLIMRFLSISRKSSLCLSMDIPLSIR